MKVHKRRSPRSQIVEVARSFSYKLNAEQYGRRYESRDFFCSRKAECWAEEAREVSDRIYAECKADVMRAVAAYHVEAQAIIAKREDEAQAARDGKLTDELERSIEAVKAKSQASNPDYKPQLNGEA